jgi:hypothetical protein
MNMNLSPLYIGYCAGCTAYFHPELDFEHDPIANTAIFLMLLILDLSFGTKGIP